MRVRVVRQAGGEGSGATSASEVTDAPHARVQARVRLGPPEDFDDFYRREIAGVLALGHALCGPGGDDAAQEAMLAAYRRWDEVALLDSPAAWVRRVCANKATSVLRRRSAEARALLRLAGRRVDDAPAPSASEFWAEVRRLPRRQAQVVALFYVCDLGVGETAATLGITDGSVKTHLSRARQALAERLGTGEEER